MMISQPANANVVQIPSNLAPKISQANAINRYSSVSFSSFFFPWTPCTKHVLKTVCLSSCLAYLRFPAGQQLVTKIVTAPMACGAVMVPTSMFMGQVVTAYSPFTQQQGQTQTITLQTQPTVPADQQTQAATLQSQQQGATQQSTKQQQPFLQVTANTVVWFSESRASLQQ